MENDYEITLSEVIGMVNEMTEDETITPMQLREKGIVLIRVGNILIQEADNRFVSCIRQILYERNSLS